MDSLYCHMSEEILYKKREKNHSAAVKYIAAFLNLNARSLQWVLYTWSSTFRSQVMRTRGKRCTYLSKVGLCC